MTEPDRLDEFFKGKPVRLTALQVAELLGISKKAVYRWLSSGTLPGYQVGGQWIILRDDLRDVMRSGSNRPPEGAAPSIPEDDDLDG